MIRIRLRRVGAKRQPSYRIVIADSRAARDGLFLENVGFYNPRTEPPTVNIKEEQVLSWLQKGAQPTDSVKSLLESKGTMARFARLRQGEPLEKLLSEVATTGAAAEKAASKTKPIIAQPQEVAAPVGPEAAEPQEGQERPEPAEAQ